MSVTTGQTIDTDSALWQSYLGFRTLGALNESAGRSSYAACPSCATVRESVIRSAQNNEVFYWLAEVEDLATSRLSAQSYDDPLRCGFCELIWQQFWQWQPARHRLTAQIAAAKYRAAAANLDRGLLSAFERIWEEASHVVDQLTTDHYRKVVGNSLRDCMIRSCGICHQDESAYKNYGSYDALCPACRQVLSEHCPSEGENSRLRPVIPLLLLARVSHDRSSLHSLRVRHITGLPLNTYKSGTWQWMMYTMPDDPAAKIVPPFHRASYDADGVYQQIRSWRTACASHETCQIARSSAASLPTRLLEVKDNICRLRENLASGAEYVALSYRWGAPQPARLLTTNMSMYERAIDVCSLPVTIQEAIKVTRELGLNHLWCDSMCIVQDDDADKLQEIAKMREVYRNSTLTVCATGARTCEEGFFATATNPGLSFRTPDVGINYPVTMPDGAVGHVRLAERALYLPEKEALAGRGWTYQEGVLPISTVSFGACLTWECLELTDRRTATSLTGGIDACVPFSALFQGWQASNRFMRSVLSACDEASSKGDSGPVASSALWNGPCPMAKVEPRDSTPERMIGQCTCSNGAFFAAWQLAILEYTKRQLTDAADKLPAIGGFPEALSRLHTDGYLAGLWRSRLLHGIMWHVNKSNKAQVVQRHAWRAPSWSWASLDAPIEMIGAHNRITECALDHGRLIKQVEVAKIIEASVELQDPRNLYGAVRSGWVQISGPMRRVSLLSGKAFMTLRIEGLDMPLSSPHFNVMAEAGDFAYPKLDMPYHSSQDLHDLQRPDGSTEVWALQLREEIVSTTRGQGEANRRDVRLLDGLILLPIDEGGETFRRIGVWVTDFTVVVEDKHHPFLGLEHEIITIC